MADEYAGLRARLGTDDPYSPGNALESIAKTLAQKWAKWRMSDDPTPESIYPGAKSFLDISHKLGNESGTPLEEPLMRMPASTGRVGGIVVNPGHPDFQFLKSKAPKVADALERMPKEVTFDANPHLRDWGKGDTIYGQTSYRDKNAKSLLDTGGASPVQSTTRDSLISLNPKPELSESDQLLTLTHEALHALYGGKQFYGTGPMGGLEGTNQGHARNIVNALPSALTSPMTYGLTGDYKHWALDSMARNIMKRLKVTPDAPNRMLLPGGADNIPEKSGAVILKEFFD